MASLNKGDMTFVPDDQEYNKMFDSIKNFHGEAWIGIFDHLPHKVLVSADISNPDMPSDGVVKVMTDITYKDWNKPVTVEAPKETTTIEQLMSSIMGGSVDMMAEPDLNDATPVPGGSSDSLTNARIKGTEAKIKSLLASMRAQAEIFYDSNSNSYKGFCTSRGQNGAYTLAVQLPNNTNYKCYDSNTSWAAGAQLIEKGYYCVDSTGFSDDTNSIAKSTSCK
jgi:hypothetical protein